MEKLYGDPDRQPAVYLTVLISILLHAVLIFFFPEWFFPAFQAGALTPEDDLYYVTAYIRDPQPEEAEIPERTRPPEPEPEIERPEPVPEPEEPEETPEKLQDEPQPPEEPEFTEPPQEVAMVPEEAAKPEQDDQGIELQRAEILTAEDSPEQVLRTEAEPDTTHAEEADAPAEEEYEPEATEQPPPPEEEAAPPLTPRTLIATKIVPSYPKDAQAFRYEGEVHLMARITSQGNLEELEVVTSSGYDDLDNQAVFTVERGWEFEEHDLPYQIELIVRYSFDGDRPETEVELGEFEEIES